MALARTCPYVDRVISFDLAAALPPFDQLYSLLRARAFALRILRDEQFQCAIVPRADIDNACALAMAYYAEVPFRIGYSAAVLEHKKVRDLGYDYFLTHRITSLSGSHEVEWSLHAASILGAQGEGTRVELWPSAQARSIAEEILSNVKRAGLPTIAISPGANLDRRKWPVRNFAALAELLVLEVGAQILFIGGGEDVELGHQLTSALGAHEGSVRNLIGVLRWDQTAALLAGCDLFIGNDSGPMHVAAAMGTACIEISCHPVHGDPFAANSPARFSPWGVRAIVLQPRIATPPCSTACVMSKAHCIRAVSILEAFDAARKLLKPEHPMYELPAGLSRGLPNLPDPRNPGYSNG